MNCTTVGEYPPQIHVKPALDVQKMENVQTCLDFLEYYDVSVNGIAAEGEKELMRVLFQNWIISQMTFYEVMFTSFWSNFHPYSNGRATLYSIENTPENYCSLAFI